mmetsp:Transcript_44691/g.65308  ORF Transcript_44691/g.65308 Transcript_44691/m.65308 type:complete len:98 (-) Transcript_44691:20-313(-)
MMISDNFVHLVIIIRHCHCYAAVVKKVGLSSHHCTNSKQRHTNEHTKMKKGPYWCVCVVVRVFFISCFRNTLLLLFVAYCCCLIGVLNNYYYLIGFV